MDLLLPLAGGILELLVVLLDGAGASAIKKAIKFRLVKTNFGVTCSNLGRLRELNEALWSICASKFSRAWVR